jgi:hypothetical protein
MSFLSEELERQIAAAGTNPLQLSKEADLSHSQIYKFFTAKQTSISEKQLTALAKALSNKKADHALLVKAHLLDEKFGPGSELVKVELRNSVDLSFMKDRPKRRSRRQIAVQYLTDLSTKDPSVCALMIRLAHVLGLRD